MLKRWQLRLYFVMKRLLDMVLAGTALILLSPVLLTIAIIIRLDSPGRATFAQERVGVRVKARNGQKFWEIRPFIVYKFRTMKQDARSDIYQKFVTALIQRDDQTITAMNGKASADKKFKLQDDPRVTRMGKFLRQTSIDELPQLWNVFRGDMSLVGSRPAQKEAILKDGSIHFGRYYSIWKILPG